MSSSSISNAASSSTSTFVTALVFNSIVFGAEIAAFTLVRPYFPAIYQPRTYVPPEQKRIGPLSKSVFLWPLAVFKADYKQIKDANGLDAYFYVRFLRMIARVFLPIWILSWIILLPVDAVHTSIPGRSGLDKLSFGNISPNRQSRYAAHLILTWFFTFWVWYNIKEEMRHFIHVRHRWLVSPEYATSAQASTVLIRGVPERYLSERALKKLFEHLPGGVAKIWLNRDLKDMPDVYNRRLKACGKLEGAETSLLNTATKLRNKRLKKGEEDVVDKEKNIPLSEALVPQDKRPTHRLPLSFMPFSLPLIGQKVDSIEWARNEIVETNAMLKERRLTLAKDVALSSAEDNSPGLPPPETNHPDAIKAPEGSNITEQTYPPMNSAFVLFKKQIAAHMSAQTLTHHAPYRMADRHLGVSPQDVVWANLNMNPYEARIRIAISWAITLGLIILWAFPVAFVGAVSNIHSLCKTYSWLAWICNLPSPVVGIITGILPPVLLAVLMMLLPIVLRLLSRLEGTPTKTDIELSLMTRYFMFQVLHSFLIVSLSSGIIATLPDLVNNPSSIPSLLAQNLPKASNFFLTYIILQGLSGTASGFLQVVPLIIYYVKLFILGSTPRSIYSIKYTLRNVSWGTLFPGTTLLVVITLAYSILSPVINGLACFSFFLFYQLWKYLFLWQLDQPASGETGGLFFPKALQHIFVGLYIQQICLAALFFLAENDQSHPSAVPEGALMVVLIAFTAFFHIIINNSYGPLIHALPLSLADKTHTVSIADSEEVRASVDTVDTTAKAKIKAKDFADGQAKANDDADGQAKVNDDAEEEENAASPSDADAVAESPADMDEAAEASSPSTADPQPIPIKPVDEDAGPKEFYHPASVEPQRVVWLPKDQLGLAEEEEKAIRGDGILVSLEDAVMDDKGHVEISGAPPGGQVRTL